MKNRVVIGIDVTADEVRAACVRHTSTGPKLTGVAFERTPEGAIDSEGLLDPQAVSEAIKSLCYRLDARNAHVSMGITACSLVGRVMEIPPVPENETRAVLRGEMDHFRILPSGQSAFDYYRLPAFPTEEAASDAEEFVRVLLMGGEERLVGSYRDAAYASDLNLLAVEPGAVSVLRALWPALKREKAVSTVIVSTTGTDIFITNAGELHFYRRVDTGTTELLNKREAYVGGSGPEKRAMGALVDDEEGAEASPEPAISSETFNRQAVSLLMTEVQRSVDYYRREFPMNAEDVFVRVAVDCNDAQSLFQLMSQHLRSKSELASPYEYLPKSPETEHEISGNDGYRYIVSIGLALREAVDEYDGAPELDLGTGDKVIMERRAAPKALLASAAVSAFLLLTAGGIVMWMNGKIHRSEDRLKNTKDSLSQVSLEHAAIVASRDRQRLLIEAIKLRDKPIREVVEFVAWASGRRASLTQLSVEESWEVRMTGETISSRYIADIMDLINRSPALEPVKLNGISRIDQSDESRGLRFDLATALFKRIPEQTAATAAPAKGG